MITIDKLKIYKKYLGNIDSWALSGKEKEFSLMNDDDWGLIYDLLQSLEIVENGVASDMFRTQTLSRLKESCDTEDTQQELIYLIGKY